MGLVDLAVGLFLPMVMLVVLIGVLIYVVNGMLIAFHSPGKGRKKVMAKSYKMTKTRRTIAMTGTLLFLVGLIHFTAWGVYGAFAVEPDYKREVHGHVLNAYYANTPELMLSELQQARDGLVGYGLTTEYSTLLPWRQTPDNRMDYQYAIIDSVMARIRAVEQDRQRQEKAGTSDQLGDVYETKMDNLRGFLHEDGWIDDIGRGAFAIKVHPYYGWWANWGGFTAVPFVGAFLTSLGALFVGSPKSGVIRLFEG